MKNNLFMWIFFKKINLENFLEYSWLWKFLNWHPFFQNDYLIFIDHHSSFVSCFIDLSLMITCASICGLIHWSSSPSIIFVFVHRMISLAPFIIYIIVQSQYLWGLIYMSVCDTSESSKGATKRRYLWVPRRQR